MATHHWNAKAERFLGKEVHKLKCYILEKPSKIKYNAFLLVCNVFNLPALLC